MYIRYRSDDLIEKSFLMLFFQEKIGKAGQIAFRISEPLECQDVITDPVQIDAYHPVAIQKYAVVPLHGSGTHAEQQRQRFFAV